MPEDSKKNPDKNKNGPKEQRKPRNARNQAGKVERKVEKSEEYKATPKVPQKPPVYQDPGPEFYKNLKRETEEILKITEEENSKYKKKVIQSNWSKYEMPMESYDEIDNHDVGADYEKLIQAPLSIGGHFQFKHEKSWDTNTGPSLYDKYFEINMDNLSLAVSTIPFYERNGIEQSLFSETDMLSMNSRATKYKQKYYNDKSYSTPETEAQERILTTLKVGLKNNTDNEVVEVSSNKKETNEELVSHKVENNPRNDDIDLDFKNIEKADDPNPKHDNESKEQYETEENKDTIRSTDSNSVLEMINKQEIKKEMDLPAKETENSTVLLKDLEILKDDRPKPATVLKISDSNLPQNRPPVKAEPKNKPVIESPEDLEKWLDDFLDS